MKKVKAAALAMAAMMLLASCGGKGGDDGDTKEIKTAPSYDTTQTAMTVGDVDVSAGTLGFYYNNYSRQTANSDEAKEAAIDQCKNNFLIVAVAHAKGVELSEDTQKELDDYKQEVVDSYDGGYEDFLDANGITDADIDAIISVSYYAQELDKEIDKSEFTDEQKREYFKNNYRRAKHILISTQDSATKQELSDKEKEEAKKKAEDLLERAQNGEDFDTLINENTQDPGSAASPDGYVFTDNEMVPSFQDGVDSIGNGEFTLVESNYGYHVIQRLPLDETPEFFETEYQKVADRIDTLMENKRFETQVYAWADEYNVTTTLNDEVIDEVTASAEKEQDK